MHRGIQSSAASKPVAKKKEDVFHVISCSLSQLLFPLAGFCLVRKQGEKRVERGREEPAKLEHLWSNFALKNQLLLSDKLLRHKPRSAAGNCFISVCSPLLEGDK